MYLVKELYCVLALYVVYDGSAFKLYDAEPLLQGSPNINLTGGELEQVLNIDPGGEYTTMLFRYEHDQFLGQYDGNKKGERCYNDHVRCLTTIMSASRPVCGHNGEGATSDFASLCDLYLANCIRKEAYWSVLDSGDCKRASKIYIYDFDADRTVKPSVFDG